MENSDQIVPGIDSFDYEKIFQNRDSSDFEYIGSCSSVTELVDILSSDQVMPESDNIELEVSESCEKEVGSEDDTDSELDVVGLTHDIIHIRPEENNEEETNVGEVEFRHSYNLRKRSRHPRVIFNNPISRRQARTNKKKRNVRPYFAIENILAYRKIGKTEQYFVKFAGYNDKENRWVRAKDMTYL